MSNKKRSEHLKISIITAVATLCCSSQSIADINTKEGAFLYGNNIQVGINKQAAFGSDDYSNQTPYHLRSEKIGFISDPSGNRFSGDFDGDFFMPAIPEAGWGIRVNNTDYHNTRNYQDHIDMPRIIGKFSNFKDLATTQEVTWQGTIDNKLRIRQVFNIYKKGLTAIIDVELKNLTDVAMQNVYYMQTVDPDNNFQSSNNQQDLKTTNKIISQGDTKGIAIVSAKQKRQGGSETGESEVKLVGYSKNARVSFGGTTNRSPVAIYTGTSTLKTTGEEYADQSISLAFKYERIAPQETVKFKVALQLANSAIPQLVLDKDKNTQAGIDNGYKTKYTVTKSATNIVDNDIEITQQNPDNLMGAEIILSTPYANDLINIAANISLPTGITKDTHRSTSTKLVLIGDASVDDYKTALKSIRYENTDTSPSLEERIVNILILDKVYTLSNAAQTFIGIVMPVLIKGKIATDDRVNQSEQPHITPSGTATPSLTVALVFKDKNNKTINTTTPSNNQGIWHSNAIDISNLADGDITLTATTTDSKGYTSTSSKGFKKDTQLEPLVISTPTANQVLDNPKTTVSGTADPDATINVTIDATNHCTVKADSSGNWSCPIQQLVLDKTYTATVTATDNVGNKNQTIQPFKTAPLVLTITAPKDNDTVSGRSPLVSGSSLPLTNIIVSVGNKKCTTVSDEKGRWNCTIKQLPIGGPHLLSVQAEGRDGITKTTQKRHITVPNKPLVVTSPVHNSVIKGSIIEVTGSSDPQANITASTGVTGESCNVLADSTGAWRCQFTIKQADDIKTLTIHSEIEGATKKTATVTTKHPTLLAITSPTDKSTVASSSPVISGKSIPNSKIIASIGDKKCTAKTSDTGDWHCTLNNLPVGGPHILIINATNSDGLKKSVTLAISVPAQPLVVTSPTQNEQITTDTLTTIGTTDPQASINVSSGETGESCTVKADATGAWRCSFPIKVATDSKTLTITSTLAGIDKKTATVTTQHPSLLQVSSPQDKTTVASRSPLISGTSIPNTKITATVGDKSCTTTSSTEDWSCLLNDLPIGGPHLLVIKAETPNGLKKSVKLNISVPTKPLVITSPQQNAVVPPAAIVVKGTTDPSAKVTVTTGITNETCSSIANSKGDWSCQFAASELSNTKTLHISSRLNKADEKIATVNINLEKAVKKGNTDVTTVLKGSGSSAPFVLLLMVLNILFMRHFLKK
ncbi:MAG: hypothetical protein KAG20_09195 [Cocleimonas sp.]|nr:hypothetical protein [Cocleimonas sp.]